VPVHANIGLSTNPKTRNGSNATLSATLPAMRYSGVLVSPHPRMSASKMKNQNMKMTPRKTTLV
jgi:hypothetical protein